MRRYDIQHYHDECSDIVQRDDGDYVLASEAQARIAELEAQLDDSISRGVALSLAVEKLVKAKGRYHTEQNYKALADALEVYRED